MLTTSSGLKYKKTLVSKNILPPSENDCPVSHARVKS